MRDPQEEAEQLNRKEMWIPVRGLGLERAYMRGWGKIRLVLAAVKLGVGKPAGIGHVNYYNPWAVKRWLETQLKRFGRESSGY